MFEVSQTDRDLLVSLSNWLFEITDGKVRIVATDDTFAPLKMISSHRTAALEDARMVLAGRIASARVTQGDIDRAADVLAAMADVPTGLEQVEACRQAFARHRLAAIEECAKVADAARTGWINGDARTPYGQAYQNACLNIAEAIRSLAPPPPPAVVGGGGNG